MSQKQHIKEDVSSDVLRQKLTIVERAELLCDLFLSLGIEDYMMLNENGSWAKHDINAAIHDLKEIDQKENK